MEVFLQSLNNKDKKFLKGGSYHFRIPPELEKEWDELVQQRQSEVKKEMEHFWKGYQQYAWGSDELLPVSNAGLDNNGHVGITLVEALDTLWLMGMRKEFDAAVKWIRESLSLDVNMEVSAFDYNARLLGGLLSAYELSRRGILLEKAVEVGDLLLRTFQGSGFPAVGVIGFRDGQPLINPRTGALEQSSSKVFLAEVGSLTLEMNHLSRITQDPRYSSAVRTMYSKLFQLPTFDGLVFLHLVRSLDGAGAEEGVQLHGGHGALLRVPAQGLRAQPVPQHHAAERVPSRPARHRRPSPPHLLPRRLHLRRIPRERQVPSRNGAVRVLRGHPLRADRVLQPELSLRGGEQAEGARVGVHVLRNVPLHHQRTRGGQGVLQRGSGLRDRADRHRVQAAGRDDRDVLRVVSHDEGSDLHRVGMEYLQEHPGEVQDRRGIRAVSRCA
ncbi:uncharacterized protein [Blastocystis hominis]|uniref:alpha-1,2-Mannosidase n=1 Tax=Blastocystis hominis TaxID=12968 RepID=D8M9U0_BLAHO|nr:uncharacterized protein [Blastocystis hominis]CBK24829.2 unnamed protein product [Blastocystis hominis]|eukprot:XP_012898877.1 uncharacterized protein [Blastocystis hominis]